MEGLHQAWPQGPMSPSPKPQTVVFKYEVLSYRLAEFRSRNKVWAAWGAHRPGKEWDSSFCGRNLSLPSPLRQVPLYLDLLLGCHRPPEKRKEMIKEKCKLICW